SGSSTNSFNNVSITGSLTAPSANMNVAGNWSNSGTFNANSGTVTFNGASTYTIKSGSSSFNNITFNNASGKWSLTDNLTASNDLTLTAGTIDIGATNLTVNGTYTQGNGSTLALTANSSSAYGSITSSVAADVNSGSTVNVTVGGYIPNNATLTIVDTGGSGIGSAPSTVTSSNSFVAFAAASSGGNLVLTANRAANGFSSVANNSNAAAVGNALDNITNPTADMTTVLDTLSGLSDGQVASSEDTMSPPDDRGAVDASNNTLSQFVGTTIVRLQDSKVEEDKAAAAIDAPLKNDIWAQSYGDYAQQGKRGVSNGYLARLWGIVVGIDHVFMDNTLRLGFAQGFGWSRIRSKDNGGRTGISSYQSGLYGEYQGKDSPYIIDAVLTYGYNDYNSSRNVVIGSINRTASSDYDGQQFSTYLEGGYKIKSKDLDIIPLLALSYAHLHVSGYTETGAGSMNLNVDAQNYDNLQLGAGCRFTRHFEGLNAIFTPEVHFRYFYSVINDKQQSLASFTGGGTSFQTSGFRPAPSSFNFGGRLELFNKKNITLLVTCDTVFKEGYYEAGGSLVAKYSF
ncbi:MAG: autotransporter domain-containing protein, partial [Candidatus Omnitrophota bacterium]